MRVETESALRKFIRRLLLRSELTPTEVAAIASMPATLSQAGPHRDQVRPGQSIDHSCMVVKGLAARFDQLADGKRQFTAVHLPGDLCDLHSVPAPVAGWGITSLTRTTFLHVPHNELRRLTDTFPAIAVAFWRDTALDASILSKWISALGRRSADARLAHLLCEVGVRLELAGEGTRNRFVFQATQTHIADFLGISAVHVNRSLQTLRARSLVTTDGYRYDITRFEELASFAQFDPAYLLLDATRLPRPSVSLPAPAGSTSEAA